MNGQTPKGILDYTNVLHSLRNVAIFFAPLLLVLLTTVQSGQTINPDLIKSMLLSFFVDLLKRSMTDYTQ